MSQLTLAHGEPPLSLKESASFFLDTLDIASNRFVGRNRRWHYCGLVKPAFN
jgi:hypothetical protein